MKTLLKCILCLCIASTIYSCDTRSDKFMATESNLFIGIDKESIISKNETIKVRHGQTGKIYYKSETAYAEHSKLEILVDAIYEPMTCIFSVDTIEKCIIISSTSPTETLGQNGWVNLRVQLTDYWGNESSATIRVLNHDNKAPEVKEIKVFSEDSNLPLEKTIIAVAEDEDGDSIIAYEYLIAGTREYDEIGYEDPNDTSMFNVNTGKAASGGTYIHAIPETSVKHVFQSYGTYGVFEIGRASCRERVLRLL